MFGRLLVGVMYLGKLRNRKQNSFSIIFLLPSKPLVITASLRSDIHDYPVGATIHDVAEYYKGGTFVGAINNIQKQAAVA